MAQSFDPQKIQDVKSGKADPAYIHQVAQEALAWAREVSQEQGQTSAESAYAWDTVEELLAAIADRRAAQGQQTALEEYCERNPSADQCRMYDV